MVLEENQLILCSINIKLVRKAIEKWKKLRGKRQLIVPDITFHSHSNDNKLEQCMSGSE